MIILYVLFAMFLLVCHLSVGFIVLSLSISFFNVQPPQILENENEVIVGCFIFLLCLLWPLWILKLIASPTTWGTLTKLYTGLIEVFFK